MEHSPLVNALLKLIAFLLGLALVGASIYLLFFAEDTEPVEFPQPQPQPTFSISTS